MFPALISTTIFASPPMAAADRRTSKSNGGRAPLLMGQFMSSLKVRSRTVLLQSGDVGSIPSLAKFSSWASIIRSSFVSAMSHSHRCRPFVHAAS